MSSTRDVPGAVTSVRVTKLICSFLAFYARRILGNPRDR